MSQTPKPYKKSLFMFRRDLRLEDNTALNQACSQSEQVLCVFIFDERQVGSNPYKGLSSLQFMYESLQELDKTLRDKGSRLFVYQGKTAEIVKAIIKNESIEALFINKDYTPFAIERDKKLESICQKSGCGYFGFEDAFLQAPGAVLKKDGSPYTVYTPFYKAARQLEVARPVKFSGKDCLVSQAQGLELSQVNLYDSANSRAFSKGGRSEGLKLLKAACKLREYDQERNIPAIRGTSGLSPHHKFGTISIREVYHKICEALGAEHTLIRELYWRDFFSHISFHFPHVYGNSFYRHFDRIKWRNDKQLFKLWCEGRTGFPIVDAGMRELNTTGFMHNRVRMIVASFLTKDLHIDWRWGEKYFAQKLVDYDPAVNNGNWQWAASTGCDAQPYFRIFNPWLQQERFDPDCEYIKRWVPELKDLPVKAIHGLAENPQPLFYSEPIVDHHEQKEEAEEMYRAAKEQS